MKKIQDNARIRFLAILAGAAGFVLLSGQSLPELVASHFNPAGVADGHMPRALYLGAILGLVIVAPVLTVWLPSLALKSPDVRINVPNRAYWLSPDHRNETVNTIRAFMIHFASLFTVFLAYAHWLIVQANLKHPPIFPSSRMAAGIAVLLAAACVLIRRLVARFRIPSNAIKSDT